MQQFHSALLSMVSRFLLDIDSKKNLDPISPLSDIPNTQQIFVNLSCGKNKSLFMTEIPCFIGISTILTLKEQPKNPANCLLSLILLDLRQNIHTTITFKSTKIPLALVNSYHKDVSETIQFYTSIQKDDVCFSSNKRKSQLMYATLLIWMSISEIRLVKNSE